MRKLRVGIDIGKVIIGGSGSEDTSFFSDNYLATPEVSESFESIARISSQHDVWLISKCGQKVQDKTLEWLLRRDFYESAAVLPERVLFVRKRPEKAPLAVSLGLDVFIDDREDIISSMQGHVPHPVLFKSWDQTLAELESAGLLTP